MQIPKPASKQPMPENAKRVFKGVIFDVYQWQQPGYDGSMHIFEKIKRSDTVLIIPITDNKEIIMSKQEQPGKVPFIGTIGGRMDEGEGPLEAAKRELLEETGYEAAVWELFDAAQPVSKIDWSVYIFVAKGCHKVAGQNLDGAEKIELMFVSFHEFVDLVLGKNFGDQELRVKLLEAKLDPAKMAGIKRQFGMAG